MVPLYTDWYLPSIDELMLMESNFILYGVNLPFSLIGTYWSSTEANFSYAYAYSMGGTVSVEDKDSSHEIIAIRSF